MKSSTWSGLLGLVSVGILGVGVWLVGGTTMSQNELSLPERCSSIAGEWLYRSQQPTCMLADGTRLLYSEQDDDFLPELVSIAPEPAMLSAATESVIESCHDELDLSRYKVEEKFSGRISVDFESFPAARLYRTAISKDVARGANFAGKYALSTWGCGVGCVGSAVINAESGRILWYGHQASHYSFSLTSRLLYVGDELIYEVANDEVEPVCADRES